MLTFENVLTVFRDYLGQDPEEEVLPCRRGYVRISWNSDSRYCVDGVLCRTPEELFDLLLQDYWDFELIRRTQGRREATAADEEAVDESGRRSRRRTVPAIPGLEKGGAEMRVVWFILKLGLKILAAPVVLALALFTWVCFGLLYVSSFIFGLVSTLVALLGIAVLVTYSPKNGIILLVIAFLVSPVGLPMAAAWLVSKVQDLRYAIQDAVYG